MVSPVRVLLVEERDADAAYVAEVLRSQAGGTFTLERSSNLKEAKTMLRDKSFAIVLTDLTLPDSKGIDTFVSLRTQFPDIPIVVLSSINDNQLAYEIIRRGAQDYLVKGI